jgi:hypothetical protein
LEETKPKSRINNPSLNSSPQINLNQHSRESQPKELQTYKEEIKRKLNEIK